MPMLINCSKGCGHAIEVSDELLAEARQHGRPIDVTHELCPGEEGAPLRKFNIKTIVTELKAETLNVCVDCAGDIGKNEDGTWSHVGGPDYLEGQIPDPHDAAPRVDEVEEIVTSMGDTVEAVSFADALHSLQDNLNVQWNRIRGLAHIVDAGDPEQH